MAIRLLANENFPYRSILFLKSLGFDVLSIGADYFILQHLSTIHLLTNLHQALSSVYHNRKEIL